ncbi:MAG: glycerophosphoryl diester phosphodiesterase [Nitrospinaceae bacterium]|nr:MAG: glycerophosphoryl diester phosphodiesterase [Nitrospinaceae bacterium]
MKIQRKRGVKLFIYAWAVLIFSCGTVGQGTAKCPTRMGSEFSQQGFLVIAHRGSTTKFPENTLPAFEEALQVDGANALQVDLSLTRDGKVVLWHDWDPNDSIALIRQEGREPVVKFKPSGPLEESRWRKKISELTLTTFREHYGYQDKITQAKSDIQIPTIEDFIGWAAGQETLRAVFFKLRVPADESRLAPLMLQAIKNGVDRMHPPPGFDLIFVTPHEEILNRVKHQFSDFLFSYDREIPAVGITNYHRFTSVPHAMQFKNRFAGIGLQMHTGSPILSPWEIYQHILTMDFKIRDNYQKSDSNYIKMISWTFNDEEKLWCLIHLGVDGIVTDRPGTLRRIALELGKVLD